MRMDPKAELIVQVAATVALVIIVLVIIAVLGN